MIADSLQFRWAQPSSKPGCSSGSSVAGGVGMCASVRHTRSGIDIGLRRPHPVNQSTVAAQVDGVQQKIAGRAHSGRCCPSAASAAPTSPARAAAVNAAPDDAIASRTAPRSLGVCSATALSSSSSSATASSSSSSSASAASTSPTRHRVGQSSDGRVEPVPTAQTRHAAAQCATFVTEYRLIRLR